MQNPKHTASRETAAPLLRQPFSFSCTCCELTENRPVPEAPAGWAIEYVKGTGYAFCPDCAIDLPRGGAQ